MNEEIRVRFAPSPTGPLHLGNARTALFSWLFTRSKSGKFILRIEDTDKERSKDEFLMDITDGLSWLGLDWDEGPERKEPYGPYLQSQRLALYKKYADELFKNSMAYRCYCAPEDLEKERQGHMTRKEPSRYSGRCQKLTSEQITQYEKEGRKFSLRFKVKSQKVKFKDLIRGPMEFDSALFGDFVIMRSDGLPTFMFAGAVDDFLMKITHVIRGEDHLSNTPRQILLSEALNFPTPEYSHLPLILNPDRSKLSKRKNPTSINQDFRRKGYLPEVMINFLVLMGWSSKAEQEFWTLEELITEFDLTDVGKSPAVFDADKLDFLNGYYIRQLSLGNLAKVTSEFLGVSKFTQDRDKFLTALSLVQERLKKLSDVPEQIEFFYQRPKGYEKIIVSEGSTLEKTKLALKEAYAYLSKEDDFGRDSLEQLLRAVAQKNGLKAGEVLWPIRVALTGKDASPGTFEILAALGKKESLERIKSAIDVLK